MNIKYVKKFHPIIECIGFLEFYAAHKETSNVLKILAKKDPLVSEQLQLLDTLAELMGAIIERKYEGRLNLFQVYKEGSFSLISELLYTAYDFKEKDSQLQFQMIKHFYMQHPLEFLRSSCNSLTSMSIDREKENDIKHYDEEKLLNILNEIDIDAGLKWKIFNVHFQKMEILDWLESMLEEVLPIYQRYETQMDDILTAFENESDPEDTNHYFYTDYLKERGFSYSNGLDTTLIIPSFANFNTLSFLEREHINDMRNEDCMVVIWGTMIHKVMKEKTTSLDSMELCTTLKLLSDPSKFEILCYLSKKEAYGAQIAKELKLTTPTISYHMQTLINAGLIEFKKDNNRLYYKLNKASLTFFLQQVQSRILKE